MIKYLDKQQWLKMQYIVEIGKNQYKLLLIGIDRNSSDQKNNKPFCGKLNF